MCSRYETVDEKELARYFKVPLELPENMKRLIYPGYPAPIVREDTNGLVAEIRFWGYAVSRPGKRDPSKLVYSIYQNARSETVDKLALFKSSWARSQRCLIPVRNFMEPMNGQFTAIIDPEEPVLGIAGIWGTTTHKEAVKDAYTMLTTAPNDFMMKFHTPGEERMPVILHPKDWAEYLSIDTPPDEAKKLLKPYSGNLAVNQ